MRAEKRNTYKRWILLPIVIAMGLVPLVMRLYVFHDHTSGFVWGSVDDTNQDLYNYYKSLLFTFMAVIMLVLLVINKFITKVEKKTGGSKQYIFIPLAVYALLAILSTAFSKYSYFGLHGMADHFETIFVILGYCILAYYCYLNIDSKEDIRFLLRGIAIFAVMLSTLGIFQYFGKDMLETDFIQRLILPSKYLSEELVRSESGSSKQLTLTLYNPNYVGLYASLILPLYTLLAYFKGMSLWKGIQNKEKAELKEFIWLFVYILIVVGMALSVVGAGSLNGYAAILVTVFVGLIVFTLRLLHNKKKAGIWMGIFLFLLLGIGIASSGRILNLLEWNKKVESNLQDIWTNKDNVKIKYRDHELTFSYSFDAAKNQFQISFWDDNGNRIDNLYDQERGRLNDDRYYLLQFIPTLYNKELVSLLVKIDGRDWVFTNQVEDGSYYYMNSTGKPDKIGGQEEFEFLKGHEWFGNARGMIWKNTIPLLKKNIFLGSGQDTFAIVYPQNDYVELSNISTNLLVDKPHNMYLQIGVQNGVLAMLAIIILFGWYLIQCIFIYPKADFQNWESKVGLAAFLALSGAMVSLLVNDSTINVMPVFWGMLGMGIGMNGKVKSKEKINEERYNAGKR